MSLVLPRAGHGPCQGREVTVSTNNGLHVCMGRFTACNMQIFPLGSSETQVSKTICLIL